MGVYRQAVSDFLHGQTPRPEITAHPFRTTVKYGFSVNLEQQFSKNLRGSARWGWNEGQHESLPTPKWTRLWRSEPIYVVRHGGGSSTKSVLRSSATEFQPIISITLHSQSYGLLPSSLKLQEVSLAPTGMPGAARLQCCGIRIYARHHHISNEVQKLVCLAVCVSSPWQRPAPAQFWHPLRSRHHKLTLVRLLPAPHQ